VTLVSTAARRLKDLLPALSGLPGPVQAEFFIIYSTLKNLGVEMEHEEAADNAKRAAFRRWLQRLRRLCRAHQGQPWAERMARLIEPGDGSTVASIMAEIAETGAPERVVGKIMEWTIGYLADCNDAELSMFRENDCLSRHRATVV